MKTPSEKAKQVGCSYNNKVDVTPLSYTTTKRTYHYKECDLLLE